MSFINFASSVPTPGEPNPKPGKPLPVPPKSGPQRLARWYNISIGAIANLFIATIERTTVIFAIKGIEPDEPGPGDNPDAPENPPVLTPDPAYGILNLLRGDIFYKGQLAYIA